VRRLLPALLLCTGLTEGASLYPHPQPYTIEAGDQALSFRQLEQRLERLAPLTYSYKPGFYSDPAHGVALWGGLYWAPALSYLGYSELAGYQERARIAQVQQRIEVLRRLKARRRCFQQ